MTLDILINHYQESEEMINNLLKSINEQFSIDFKNSINVLICSDGEDNILDKKQFNKYNFSITYFVEPHRGVCATRNFLLNKASADYVMFCDSDDCFYNKLGLYLILNAIEQNFDVIASPYLEELKKEEKIQYNYLFHDTLRVHGKVFKLQYLKENDIKFPDEMIFSGDMYFLWQAFQYTKNIYWVKESFYLWKWNNNSVTRAEKWHSIKTYNMMVKNYTLLTEELLKREKMDFVYCIVPTMFYSMYIDFNHEYFKSAPEEYYKIAELACVKYLSKYYDYYEKVDLNNRLRIYRVCCQHRNMPNGPEEGFKGAAIWINNLITKYKIKEVN